MVLRFWWLVCLCVKEVLLYRQAENFSYYRSISDVAVTKNTPEDYANDCTPDDQIVHTNPITCAAIEITLEGYAHLPSVDAEFAPGVPHGLRVYSYSSTHPTRTLNPYQLRVNISWEPPYDASQENITGFTLLIHDLHSNKQRCFVFFLPNASSKWDARHLDSPPRFRFWTVDLFSWDRKYSLELFSLPKAKPSQDSISPYIDYSLPMMKHPASAALERVLVRTKWFEKPLPAGSFDCDKEVNPDGEQWLAGFKKVYVNANDLEIEAEFIAAPPQYCFDAYELQLADQKHPLVKLEVINVTKEQLYWEEFSSTRNVTVQLGRVVFKNITVGTSYLITVIAKERDNKGRCVCMSKELLGKSKPIEKNIQCHCLGATWPLTPFPENMIMNDTGPKCTSAKGCGVPVDTATAERAGSMILLCIMLGVALLALIAGACIMLLFWNHYRKKSNNPFTRVRFIAGPGKSTTTSGSHLPLFSMETQETHAGTSKVMLKNVLIVYSHDNHQHDACVEALARYLQTNCYCKVSLDTWCMQNIANNKIDWVYKSMQQADKVIIVNSESAHYRYEARLGGGDVVERVDHVPGDDLFLLQLDYALRLFHSLDLPKEGYKKFLNIRFPYTPYTMVQKSIAPGVYFEVPRNLSQLVCHIHEMKGDKQMIEQVDDDEQYLLNPFGQQLANSVRICTEMQQVNADWFSTHHVRRKSDDVGEVERLSDSPSVSDSGISTGHAPEWHSSTHSSCGQLESNHYPLLVPQTKQLISKDSGFGESSSTFKSNDSFVKRKWKQMSQPECTSVQFEAAQ